MPYGIRAYIYGTMYYIYHTCRGPYTAPPGKGAEYTTIQLVNDLYAPIVYTYIRPIMHTEFLKYPFAPQMVRLKIFLL